MDQNELQSIASLCLELGSVDVTAHSRTQRTDEKANDLKDTQWFGLREGFMVDLQCGWNLELAEHVEALREVIQCQDPYLLKGSPPCEGLSVLLQTQRGHHAHRARRAREEKHLETTVAFYREQMQRG